MSRQMNQPEHIMKDTEDPQVLFQMGMRCLKRKSTLDLALGEKILHLAAEKGSTEAMFYLGKYYVEGKILPKDKEQGRTWLSKAAEQNHILAMRTLANDLYRARRRRRKARKRKKADHLLRKAAQLGSIEAMEELVQRLSQRFRTPEEKREGLQWAVKAKELRSAREEKRQQFEESLKKLAEEKDVEAMHRYSELLLSGTFGKEKRLSGITWLQKAAHAGSTKAMVELGQRLIKGKGIQRDVSAGVYWLEQASQQNELAAIRTLSRIYRFGKGVKKNHKLGRAWLQKAADLGSVRDMVRLGEWMKSNLKEGKAWLEKAAQHKDILGMIKLGKYFIEGPKSIRNKLFGLKWLKRADQHGSVVAKFLIGQYVVNGQFPDYHLTDGIEYLEQAAFRGSVPAMIKLYKVYHAVIPNQEECVNWRRQVLRNGSKRDIRKLNDWRRVDAQNQHKRHQQRLARWENLANAPNRVAMVHFGILLLEGKEVPKNRKLGIQWLKRAADLGSSLAMFKLGELFLEGNMIRKNDQLGREWLKRAAECGSSLAKFKIDEIQVKETKNRQELRAWYEQRAMKGCGIASARLEEVDPTAAKVIRLIQHQYETHWEEPVIAFGKKLFTEGNLNRAVFYLEPVAHQGSKQAMALLGRVLLKKGQSQKGIESIKKAAKMGSIDAMVYLVEHFPKRESWGIHQVDMLDYLRKTAEIENFHGTLYLGMTLITGELGVSDVAAGKKYLKKAIELDMNQTKKLLNQESNQRLRYVIHQNEWMTRLLAQKGDIPSMIRFGRSLISQHQVEQGKSWIQRAMDLGSIDAKVEWGKLLFQEDEFEGIQWIQEAAEQGSKKARAEIEALNHRQNWTSLNKKSNMDPKSLKQCQTLLTSVQKHNLYDTLKSWLVQKQGIEVPSQDLYQRMQEHSHSPRKEKKELSEVDEVNELQYRLSEQELLKLQKWSDRVLGASSDEESSTQIAAAQQKREEAELPDDEEPDPEGLDDQFFSAILPYAKNLLNEDDPQKRDAGRKWLVFAAKQGHPDAMILLAIHLMTGDQFDYHAEKAKQWFIRAGEHGRTDAWLRIGKELLSGEKIPQNIEEGRKWLAKAAESGVTKAAYLLGKHLFEYQEETQAMKWMERAAHQGHPLAMRILGQSFMKGDHGHRHLLAGRRWLEKQKQKQHNYQVPLKDRSVRSITKLLSIIYQFQPSKKLETIWDVVVDRLTQPYKINWFQYFLGGFPYYRKDEITSLWYQHQIKKFLSTDKLFYHEPLMIKVSKHAVERWNQRVGPILSSSELHYLLRCLYFAGRIDFFRSQIAVIDNEIVFAFERNKKQLTIKTFLGRISRNPEFANFEEAQSKMIFYQQKTRLKVSKKILQQSPFPVVPREIFHLQTPRRLNYVLSEYEYFDHQRLSTVVYFYEVNKNPRWKKIAYDDFYQPEDQPLDPSILRLLYIKGYEKYVLSQLAYHQPDQVIAILKELKSTFRI